MRDLAEPHEPTRVLVALLTVSFFAGFFLARVMVGGDYESRLAQARMTAEQASGESARLHARTTELERTLQDTAPESWEETFLQICLVDIGARSACGCVWKRIQEQYAVGEFIALQDRMRQTRRLHGRTLDDLMVCLVTVPNGDE